MALDLKKIRERQTETTRRAGGKYFKCTDGKNIIRLYTFQHKVTIEDIKKGYFKKEQLGKIVEELDRPILRHFNVPGYKGPVISNDSLLETWQKLKNSKSPHEQAQAEKLKPSRAYFLNIVNIDALDSGMVLYGCPSSVYNSILAYIQDPDYGPEILGSEGRDLVIMYDKSQNGTDKYKVLPRKEGLSQELPDKIEALDLYSEEAYSQMGEVQTDEEAETEEEEIEKVVEEKEEVDEDVETPKPKRDSGTVHSDADSIKRAAAQERAQKASEKEVEELFEDDDEEVDLEPKKKKKK